MLLNAIKFMDFIQLKETKLQIQEFRGKGENFEKVVSF